MVTKIYAYGEVVRMDGLPRNPGGNIYMSLRVGQITKLPLALKLRYKPLKGK
jgi:hypothetical protein